MLTNQDLLWVKALSTKYLHSHSSLASPIPQLASSLWKRVLNCRAVVAKGAYWSVSNGHLLNVWDSPWIPSFEGFKPSPNSGLFFLPNLNVSDLISPISRDWYLPLLNLLFDPISMSHIQAIHLPISPSLDRWIWSPSPNGSFFVKFAHSLISGHTIQSVSPFPRLIGNCFGVSIFSSGLNTFYGGSLGIFFQSALIFLDLFLMQIRRCFVVLCVWALLKRCSICF
jgi:hypothetical protein